MTIGGLSELSMALILLAGVGAGFVGYAVGAASLVSYPAVLALGIPPVVANVSNTVGVVGMGIGSMIGASKELRGQRRRAAVYVGIGAVGGIVGSLLLLKLDPTVFEFLVPPLILLSSIIIAIDPHGRGQVRQAVRDVAAQARRLAHNRSGMNGPTAGVGVGGPHATDRPAAPNNNMARPPEASTDGIMSSGAHAEANPVDPVDCANAVNVVSEPAPLPMQPMSHDPWWLWVAMSMVGVYAGYFGAGAGTVALAVLDAGKVSPFHQINALKTIIGTGANITATVVFIVNGVVNWPVAILLGIGCFLGGFIAPPITRRIPARIMRMAAVAAGVVLAVNLGAQTYL